MLLKVIQFQFRQIERPDNKWFAWFAFSTFARLPPQALSSRLAQVSSQAGRQVGQHTHVDEDDSQ